MLPRFRLGTLFGFPIRVNASFLLMLGVVLIWMGGLPGVAVALMAAASVLLHEVGHALVARHLGTPVAGIELHFFGGAANLRGLPQRPGDEIAIAAAGPAVSFALAGLGHALGALSGVSVFALFGWVNLLLGAFNLLPAFPSDGGRILRALLARKRGLVRATDLAVKVGHFVCLGLVIAGIGSGSFQLVAVAGVLWFMGGAERLAARLQGDQGAWRGEEAPLPTEVEYLPPSVVRRSPRFPGGPAAPLGGRVFVIWRS